VPRFHCGLPTVAVAAKPLKICALKHQACIAAVRSDVVNLFGDHGATCDLAVIAAEWLLTSEMIPKANPLLRAVRRGTGLEPARRLPCLPCVEGTVAALDPRWAVRCRAEPEHGITSPRKPKSRCLPRRQATRSSCSSGVPVMGIPIAHMSVCHGVHDPFLSPSGACSTRPTPFVSKPSRRLAW
jgi:hypothetical protein